MNTVKQIQKLIDTLDSFDDIRTVGQILSARGKTVQLLKAMSFRKGQQVTFTSRNGQTYKGTITKINAKTVDVNCPAGNWRVSPSMLKVA